jgi:AAA domain, putative AbiEii toxin, Type IV TA system
MTKKPSKNGHAPKPGDRPPTAYFLSLEVENVRCFGKKQKLDLSDGNGKPAPWTIILGVNGTGKTTLLQLLTNDSVRTNISSMIRKTDATYPIHSSIRIEVCGGGHDQDKYYTVIITIESSRNGLLLKSGMENQSAPSLQLESPQCYAYGAGRKIGTIAFLEYSPDDDDRSTLFHDRAELRNPEEWLIYLDYTSSTEFSSKLNRVRQKDRRDIAIYLLKQVLWEIEDIRFIPGEGVRPKPRVEFKTPYGWVPFRQLGYGYQSLATWVADFASRMVERYPESKNPLAEPAVVLVDEIDLHLHPKWQRELMDRLTNLFPNTQFIATAHSPLVVQAAANANLAVLRRVGDHVEIDNDVDYIRNWRVDQILTSDLFGLETTRPPQIEFQLLERRKILKKTKLTKADKARLKELEAEIGPMPVGETADEIRERTEVRQMLERLSRERIVTP